MREFATKSEFHFNFPSPWVYEAFKYPAGEWQVRLSVQALKHIADTTSIKITTRITSADEFMQLVMLLSALKQYGCTIRVHLPYLPYSRADRRFTQGDCDGLAAFVQLLPGGVAYSTLDAHNPAALPAWLHNQSAEPLILRAIARHARGADGVTVLFPDEGARKRYTLPPVLECNLGRFTIEQLHCTKRRNEVTGKLLGFQVPTAVQWDRVLIVDDICDGGGTFLGIAQELGLPRERLGLYVTHGIFSKGLSELLKYFQVFYTSGSWPSKWPQVVEL